MQLDLFKAPPIQDRIVNIASVPHRSPFRYPGGKTWFVPIFRHWIKSKKKKPSILIEPFAGGGIIGLTAAFEDLVEQVILVEKDEDISSVWTVILEKDYARLASELLSFDLTYKNVRQILKTKPASIYQRALQTIIRNRVSHGGIMAHGAGLTGKGENGKGLSSRWYPVTLAKRIQNIGAIRDKLSFVRGCGLDIIEKYNNSADNCFFVDPPYTVSGKCAGKRLYKHHKVNHNLLFRLFNKCPSDFLFTYDVSEEILKIAHIHQFQKNLIPMKNTHHRKMEELIIGRDLSWLRN